jgi:hypothetical protein
LSASDEEDIAKAKFFFELALHSDKVITQAYERLNVKIRHVFTIASTLIPIVVGLGYFFIKEYNWVVIPIFACLVSLLLAIFQGISLQKPTSFSVFKPYEFTQKFHKSSYRYIVEKSASTWSGTVRKNRQIINSNENGLNTMLRYITCGLSILIITFVLLGIDVIF